MFAEEFQNAKYEVESLIRSSAKVLSTSVAVFN